MKPTEINSGHQKSPYAAKANEFRKRRGWKKYMMVPNETLEKEMMDPVWPPEMRVMFAVRRLAWGNLNDFAVNGIKLKDSDPTPRPTSQKDLADLLGITPPTVNKAVSFLKKAGYLSSNHRFLFPLDNITSLESTKDNGADFYSRHSDSPYLRFRQFLIERGIEPVKIIPPLEDERKITQQKTKELSLKIREADQFAWKIWKAYQRGKNPYEYKEDNEDPKKAS